MMKRCDNCWDFNKCQKQKKKRCVAFEYGMGKECWFVSNLTQKTKGLKGGYEKCFDCGWYKKLNGSKS